MTLTPANVVAGSGKAGGYVFAAPLLTALPTDVTTVLIAAFKSKGLVSEDGLKRAISKAYETVRDWNGDEVKRMKTETSVELELALIEAANPEAIKAAFATADVSVTPATAAAGTKIAIAFSGDDPAPGVWVFELKDGPHARRIIIPNAQIVTEDFEQEFAAGSVIQIPVKLTCFKDSAGKFFYDYSDDGRFSA